MTGLLCFNAFFGPRTQLRIDLEQMKLKSSTIAFEHSPRGFTQLFDEPLFVDSVNPTQHGILWVGGPLRGNLWRSQLHRSILLLIFEVCPRHAAIL